jgi:hypothetical protein
MWYPPRSVDKEDRKNFNISFTSDGRDFFNPLTSFIPKQLILDALPSWYY